MGLLERRPECRGRLFPQLAESPVRLHSRVVLRERGRLVRSTDRRDGHWHFGFGLAAGAVAFLLEWPWRRLAWVFSA